MHETTGLRAQVKALFERELQMAIPSDELDLIESRYVDSLRFVNLLLALEREFELTVPLEDLDVDHFKSVADAAQFIVRNRAS